MAGLLAVSIEYDGPLAMKQRDINRVVRESMQWVGKYWREHMLGRHFTHAGARKYGYALRSGERSGSPKFSRSYTGYKLEKYGHTRPLVFTGDSMREALTDKRVYAKATSRMASASIPLPRKFNLRRPGSPVHMADEIRAVTRDELDRLERELVKILELKLRTFGQRRGITVRIAG